MVSYIFKMLTNKQRHFCEEYIKDHNGPEAVIRAGYNKKGRWAIAGKLLAKAKVRSFLDELEKKTEIDITLNKEYFIKLLKPIAESTTLDLPKKLSAILALAKISGVMKDISSDDERPTVILQQLGYKTPEEVGVEPLPDSPTKEESK